MPDYQNIFEKVGNERALNNWEPSLPKGKHRVALVKYGGKTSHKDRSIFLEAEFIILSSDNPDVRPGARHSWPWFVNKPDEFGYTHARAKNFLEVLQKCIGNEADTTSFGNALAEDFSTEHPEAYGMMLDVDVIQVKDAKGDPRRGRKGNEVFNPVWSAIPQDSDDIEATRTTLAGLTRSPTASSNGLMAKSK